MKYLLLDTCVWINIFSRPKLNSVSDRLIDLLDKGLISIVIPEIVKTEVERHKNTLEEKYIQATVSPLKNAKVVLSDYEGEEVDKCKNLLNILIQKIGQEKDYILTSNRKIEEIFNHRNTINVLLDESHYKDIVKLGINKKAPFIKNKNSVADAAIICSLKDIAHQYPGNCIFISENKSDFSDIQDDRKLHQDIKEYIDIELEYSLNVADVINAIVPDTIAEELIKIVSALPSNLPCNRHEFGDGCWRPSKYGGLTWHLICQKCGKYFDTGESYDD